MTLNRLPPEVLLDITDALALSAPAHCDRIPNLAALAQTNRKFYEIANPLLYRNLFLDTPRRLKILSSLASNTKLGKDVRSLTVSGGDLSVGEFEFMKEVLAKCSSVSRFTYLCFDPWYLPALTAFVGRTWPDQLRYLRSDQKDGLFELLCRLGNLEELVASRIDFPTLPHSNTLPTSPLPAAARFGVSPTDPVGPTPGPLPLVPSFRLKRFDSGSSPFASDFDLLTLSSRETLVELDLPISSESPLQDLSEFSSLSHLTLTLAERYIPHNLDSRIGTIGAPAAGGPPPRGARQDRGGERDDVKCLLRVQDVLVTLERGRLRQRAAAEAGAGAGPRPEPTGPVDVVPRDVLLERVELYQPDYGRTRAFSSSDVEASRLFEGIPNGVRELDLSTLNVGAGYVMSVFGSHGGDSGQQTTPCKGLRKLCLMKMDEHAEVDRVLSRRGIDVTCV